MAMAMFISLTETSKREDKSQTVKNFKLVISMTGDGATLLR
jgi:hypothetical protein